MSHCAIRCTRDGYAVVGNQTRIYVYDNRIHDQECMLTIDTEKYGKFVESLTDGCPLPGGNNGNWEGLAHVVLARGRPGGERVPRERSGPHTQSARRAAHGCVARTVRRQLKPEGRGLSRR